MFLHERVVVQVRISGINATDFLTLAGAQGFIRVEAPDSFEQALSPEDLMNAGNASGERMAYVE